MAVINAGVRRMSAQRIVNLTPHSLNVVMPDGNIRVIAPSGGVARVSTQSSSDGDVDGIPVSTSVFGDLVGLPPIKDSVFLVVSRLVLEAAGKRRDLLAPGELVRDEKGAVVGCRGLSR